MRVASLKTLALSNRVHSIKLKAYLDNPKRSLKSNINKNGPLICSSRRSIKPKQKLPIRRTTYNNTETLYNKANSTRIHSKR